jgi:hypothetical protein
MAAESKNMPIFESVVVTIFCIVTSYGAGYTLKMIVTRLSGWQDLAFAFGAGIFITISAVLLYQGLSALREK